MNVARRISVNWAACLALTTVMAAGPAWVQAQTWSPKRPARSLTAQRTSHEEQASPASASGSARFVPQWQQPPGQRDRQAVHYYEQAVPAANDEVIIGEPEIIEPGTIMPDQEGEIVLEPDVFEEWEVGPSGDCETGQCDVIGPHGQWCEGFCIPRAFIDESSLFLGTQGFKGPLDQGLNGNFGFHEGVNFAGHFGDRFRVGPLGLGYQVGALFVQSDLSGSQAVVVQDSAREQVFITAGLFRRSPRNHGWQFGAVYDWMNDSYYIDINLSQIRTEISWLTPCGHEAGFWGAFSTRTDTDEVLAQTQTFESTDQYALFYRYNLPNGAFGRAWAGATSSEDGLLGADFRVPLSNRWEFNGAFNYLIPEESSGIAGSAEESWGLTLNLAWFPLRRPVGQFARPFRPLFGVADNTTFMVDRIEP